MTGQRILHLGYTVLPIVAGADKFLNLLTDWEKYLPQWVESALPIAAGDFMLVVGAIEIVAGILVAVRPRIGAIVVALWLLLITIQLATQPEYWDIALRDFGLCLGALALFQLSASRATDRLT